MFIFLTNDFRIRKIRIILCPILLLWSLLTFNFIAAKLTWCLYSETGVLILYERPIDIDGANFWIKNWTNFRAYHWTYPWAHTFWNLRTRSCRVLNFLWFHEHLIKISLFLLLGSKKALDTLHLSDRRRFGRFRLLYFFKVNASILIVELINVFNFFHFGYCIAVESYLIFSIIDAIL